MCRRIYLKDLFGERAEVISLTMKEAREGLSRLPKREGPLELTEGDCIPVPEIVVLPREVREKVKCRRRQ